MLKTEPEIESLKRNWQADPCWDIETTEGFEEYKEELTAYRIEMEVKWENEYQDKLLKYANKVGTENLKLAQYICFLEDKIEKLVDKTNFLENEIRSLKR